MPINTKAKKGSFFISVSLLIIGIIISILFYGLPRVQSDAFFKTIQVKSVNAGILAKGSISSLDTVSLHFQTLGKLAYLPVQVGDAVTKGEVIARLDTYALQRDLSQALNDYITQRNTFDQTNQNNNNGFLYQAEGTVLNSTGNSNAINDAVKRILQNNQVALSNSVLSVEIANEALNLATLVSPINGVVTAEDVTTPGVNVTATTAFSVADPSKKVFTADVSQQDISFVKKGASVVIRLDSDPNKAFVGTVLRIHPQETVVSGEGTVYEADIQSSAFDNYASLGQEGSVVIQSSYNQTVMLVPSWLVLNNQYVWTLQDNKPVLRKVQTGDMVGSNIEVFSGISPSDMLISNPKSIVAKHYLFF